MARKRAFGEISKLPSGKFRARYTGPDGKRHSASTTFFTRDDATIWLRSEERLIEFDQWEAPSARAAREDASTDTLTVGTWLTQWLDLRSRGINALKPSTLQSYRAVLERTVLTINGEAAALRGLRLVDVTRKDILAWWDALQRQRSTHTDNAKGYKRLHTAFSEAVDRELIPTSPVRIAASSRRETPKRKELPTVEIMDAVIDQLDHTVPRVDGRHKLIAILTLFHGLRIGEALALRRKDITIGGEHIIVHIRTNVYRQPGEGMVRLDTPKTDSGHRDVPIFSRFHNDVHWHLKTFVGNTPDATLFPSPNGKIIMDTTHRSVLTRAKMRAGHEDVELTPHYGRVWLITTLAEQGMPIPAIGELLGQRDLKTITETYMRHTEEKRREILGRVDGLLGGGPAEVVDLDARRRA